MTWPPAVGCADCRKLSAGRIPGSPWTSSSPSSAGSGARTGSRSGACAPWRRHGLATILGRLGKTSPAHIDALLTLTSFETYDLLATEDRSREQVAALIQSLARAVLQTSPPSASASSSRR